MSQTSMTVIVVGWIHRHLSVTVSTYTTLMSINKPRQLSVTLLSFFEINREAFTDSWSNEHSNPPPPPQSTQH